MFAVWRPRAALENFIIDFANLLHLIWIIMRRYCGWSPPNQDSSYVESRLTELLGVFSSFRTKHENELGT